MPLWRPHAIVVVGAVVLASGAAGAPAAGVIPTPLWMSPNGNSFAVTTTGAWRVHGAAPGADRVRVVETFDRAIPTSSTAEGRQGRMAVWAPACTAGAQTIRLSRTVEVPGPPGTVAAGITPVTGAGLRIASAALYVNGQLLVKTGAGGQGGLGPTAAKASLFRFGQNTVELVATKAPSASRCNVSKVTTLGVLAFVHGDFATDLALGEASDRFYDGSTSSHVRGDVDFTVRNNGPGGAARGRFWFTVALPYTDDIEFVDTTKPVNGPFRDCEIVKSKSGPTYDGSCEFADFAPRSSYTLHLRYGAGNARRWNADVSVLLRWGVYLEGNDTSPSNNERIAKLWWCARGLGDGGKSCRPA